VVGQTTCRCTSADRDRAVELRYIPKVVGVAAGVHKAEAILGALRGGFLDVLVTNEEAAIGLLDLQRGRG
jgi:DNA-binding transcriptional regulator LsrR (DeoR family)